MEQESLSITGIKLSLRNNRNILFFKIIYNKSDLCRTACYIHGKIHDSSNPLLFVHLSTLWDV